MHEASSRPSSAYDVQAERTGCSRLGVVVGQQSLNAEGLHHLQVKSVDGATVTGPCRQLDLPLGDLDDIGRTARATGTESRVTMISPAVASFLFASGHLSRISRIDIRTIIRQQYMFHSKG